MIWIKRKPRNKPVTGSLATSEQETLVGHPKSSSTGGCGSAGTKDHGVMQHWGTFFSSGFPFSALFLFLFARIA